MKLIAAIDQRGGLSYHDTPLFSIPQDRAFFKDTTMGSIIVMGHKTFAALPHGALPGRTNLVLSRNAAFQAEDATVCSGPSELANTIRALPAQPIWVIGGAEIYHLLMPYCEAAILTEVAAVYPADCFLPALPRDWACVSARTLTDNDLNVQICEYRNPAPLSFLEAFSPPATRRSGW